MEAPPDAVLVASTHRPAFGPDGLVEPDAPDLGSPEQQLALDPRRGLLWTPDLIAQLSGGPDGDAWCSDAETMDRVLAQETSLFPDDDDAFLATAGSNKAALRAARRHMQRRLARLVSGVEHCRRRDPSWADARVVVSYRLESGRTPMCSVPSDKGAAVACGPFVKHYTPSSMDEMLRSLTNGASAPKTPRFTRYDCLAGSVERPAVVRDVSVSGKHHIAQYDHKHRRIVRQWRLVTVAIAVPDSPAGLQLTFRATVSLPASPALVESTSRAVGSLLQHAVGHEETEETEAVPVEGGPEAVRCVYRTTVHEWPMHCAATECTVQMCARDHLRWSVEHPGTMIAGPAQADITVRHVAMTRYTDRLNAEIAVRLSAAARPKGAAKRPARVNSSEPWSTVLAFVVARFGSATRRVAPLRPASSAGLQHFPAAPTSVVPHAAVALPEPLISSLAPLVVDDRAAGITARMHARNPLLEELRQGVNACPVQLQELARRRLMHWAVGLRDAGVASVAHLASQTDAELQALFRHAGVPQQLLEATVVIGQKPVPLKQPKPTSTKPANEAGQTRLGSYDRSQARRLRTMQRRELVLCHGAVPCRFVAVRTPKMIRLEDTDVPEGSSVLVAAFSSAACAAALERFPAESVFASSQIVCVAGVPVPISPTVVTSLPSKEAVATFEANGSATWVATGRVGFLQLQGHGEPAFGAPMFFGPGVAGFAAGKWLRPLMMQLRQGVFRRVCRPAL